MDNTETEIANFVRDGINLASADLGAKALATSNDFFGAVDRMLQDIPAHFEPGLYDDAGKYMDGWESTRRRTGGNDHAIVQLAVPGTIRGFDIDTSFFTGNFAPAASVEACFSTKAPDQITVWTNILEISPLGASAHHVFPCASDEVWSHLRLNIFPDGGVARFRVYGEPWLDPATPKERVLDLASALNGGRIVGFSDAHFGNSHRILLPSFPKNMGDGWDTRRRRVPGHEWIVVALGARGSISEIIVDTAFHKGNFPVSVSVQAATLATGLHPLPSAVLNSAMFWRELLPQSPLTADAIHSFSELADIGAATHVRVNIYPDGGICRLKVMGTLY